MLRGRQYRRGLLPIKSSEHAYSRSDWLRYAKAVNIVLPTIEYCHLVRNTPLSHTLVAVGFTITLKVA